MTAGAAVASERHQRDGVECEDKIAGGVAGKRRRRVVALALADGAGSAKRAAIGAEIAAKAACAELIEGFDLLAGSDPATIAERVISRVRESIEHAAVSHDAPLEDFACTLAFVAVRRKQFIAGSIGDSVVASS